MNSHNKQGHNPPEGLPKGTQLTQLYSTRAKLNQEIRSFFTSRGYTEVETPSLAKHLIPESTIHPFTTTYYNEFAGGGERYLIPSPEVHLKQLIAKGMGNIYEIARSFRNYEQLGTHHNPEFTMLEWYTMQADYLASAQLMQELWQHLFTQIAPKNPLAKAGWISMTVEEACKKHAGFEFTEALTMAGLKQAALDCNITPAPDDTWESLFHKIFLTHVEPNFPKHQPLLLFDYPTKIPSLAKQKPGTPYSQRWELFVGSLEVANCYTEEDNPKKVAQTLDQEYALRLATPQAPVVDRDMHYPKIFETFPACSGVALGVDRLFMLLIGASDIHEVLPLSC